MPWAVLAPLVACAFAMGALLGGAEVATVAFADEQGRQAAVRPAARDLGARQPALRGGHRRAAAAGLERDALPLGAAGPRPADAAAAVRARVRAARAGPVPVRIRDLPHPDRQLRVDRGDGPGRPGSPRASRCSSPGSAPASPREPPSSASSSTRPARPRATGSPPWPVCSGLRWPSAPAAGRAAGLATARATGGQLGGDHRPTDRPRERRPGRAHQHPLGHREVGQPAADGAPTPASARPRTRPARRTAPARAAGAAG